MSATRSLSHPLLYSRLVTLLKVIDAPIQVSDICVLTICLKVMNFSFHILPLFVPEMYTSLMSYMVQIIYIALDHVTTAV